MYLILSIHVYDNINVQGVLQYMGYNVSVEIVSVLWFHSIMEGRVWYSRESCISPTVRQREPGQWASSSFNPVCSVVSPCIQGGSFPLFVSLETTSLTQAMGCLAELYNPIKLPIKINQHAL